MSTLVVSAVERVFSYTDKKGKEVMLEEVNPHFSPAEVLRYYSNIYPELTTATILDAPVTGSKLVYTFKTTVGTKG